jgi:hypothetical protein
MLNHFALVSPLSPNSILSLCHGKLPKVVLAFITLNREGGVGGGGGRKGDKVCFVNVDKLCNISWSQGRRKQHEAARAAI